MNSTPPGADPSASPYAPPKANVAVTPAAAPSARPWQVARAVKCLWVIFGLGIALALWSLAEPKPMQTVGPAGAGPGSTFMLVLYIFIFALSLWIYTAIGRGRNWARIVYLVFTVFGALSLPFIAFAMIRGVTPIAQGIGGLFNTCLSFYVFYLLVTRPAREWFAAMSDR